MNESTSRQATLPPIIPTPVTVQDSTSTRHGWVERTRELPRRDTDRGLAGGVCAGLAREAGVSPVLIRLAAVALMLGAGMGLGAYLVAWALMPDQSRTSHLERAVRQGTGRSVVVSLVATLAALGMVTGALALIDSALPEIVEIAILAGLGWWGWTHLKDRKAEQAS